MNKTPIDSLTKISDMLDVDLKVKRDDLYPNWGGGSKARKICKIIEQIKINNCNAIVTAGAANSNHARVVSLVAAQNGWKCIIIIHDKEDYNKDNLFIMKLAGADLRFVNMTDVADAMDSAMHEFYQLGYKPYYIWGGGHNINGMLAYYEAAKEATSQLKEWVPDYIIHASGTGGTQSGLCQGFYDCNKLKTKVIGISIARNQERAENVVMDGVIELATHLGLKSTPRDQIRVDDRWLMGGYGLACHDIIDTIRLLATKEGLLTDPTYSGKAFHGLFQLIMNNEIKKGSRVLFWHTGGLINLFQHKAKFL